MVYTYGCVMIRVLKCFVKIKTRKNPNLNSISIMLCWKKGYALCLQSDKVLCSQSIQHKNVALIVHAVSDRLTQLVPLKF